MSVECITILGEKGITIQSAATFAEWGDNLINIIDTPGVPTNCLVTYKVIVTNQSARMGALSRPSAFLPGCSPVRGVTTR